MVAPLWPPCTIQLHEAFEWVEQRTSQLQAGEGLALLSPDLVVPVQCRALHGHTTSSLLIHSLLGVGEGV